MTFVPRAIVEAELILQQMLRDKRGVSPERDANERDGVLLAMVDRLRHEPETMSDDERQNAKVIKQILERAQARQDAMRDGGAAA